MNTPTPSVVIDKDGQRGVLERLPTSRETTAGEEATLRLQNGRRVSVPARALNKRPDGTLIFSGSFTELNAAGTGTLTSISSDTGPVVIPVVEEEFQVEKRKVEAGGVRVTKTVREREEVIDEPLVKEEVQVKRVPVNRVVDGRVEIRQEGETMIVPVLEEVLVVEKRLVLKEEWHITRRRVEAHSPQRVILRSEEVSVDRFGRQEQQEESGGEQLKSAASSE